MPVANVHGAGAPALIDPRETPYRWLVLSLAAITNTLVVAAPSMAMPVLFAEISADLKLSLVQVGVIWGISSLPAILTGLLGGSIGDRFGPRKVILIGCLLSAVFGGLRGFSNNFATLLVGMFLLGMVSPLVVMNNLKMSGMWFTSRQLGLASGFLSMGMALGFLLGSALSATVISPLLGGWRAVMFFYGGLALLLALPWFFIRQPAQAGGQNAAPRLSMRQAFVHVLKIRNVWLLGITILGMSGCVQGVLGYLPLHLRNTGWSATSADSALATFHLLSLICTIPIAMISDRLGTRKWVMVVTTLMMLTGVSLLGVVSGPWVWAAVVLAGMVRDGYMAVLMTNVIEIKDVGVAYAGTATGMVMFFSGIGNLVSPPVGNSLAAVSPGAPFFFWAGLLGMGMLGLLATKRNA